MERKIYTVADGVDIINGAQVPADRKVTLSDREALHDKALGRIAIWVPLPSRENGLETPPFAPDFTETGTDATAVPASRRKRRSRRG